MYQGVSKTELAVSVCKLCLSIPVLSTLHYKERQGWFDQHEAEIYTYKINGDLSVVSDEQTIVITDGTIKGSGIDYSHNKGYIYYEQRSLTNLTAQTTNKGTWTYNVTSATGVSRIFV